MKRFVHSVIFAVLALTVAAASFARPVSFTEERVGCIGSASTIPNADCPTDNNTFGLTFDGLPAPKDGFGGTVLVEAFGDFCCANEYLVLDFDSQFSADRVFSVGGVDYVTIESQTFELTPEQLTAALADGTFRLGVRTEEVDAYDGIFDPRRDSFVRATLQYRTATGGGAGGDNTGGSGKTLSWTGEELYDDRKVEFPTDSPVLNGTSLSFYSGTIGNGKLIEYDLKGIPKNKDVVIRVQMNLTRLSSDWDPYIVLTDGTNWRGIAVFDSTAPGGGVSRLEGTDNGDRGTITTNTELFRIATGFPAVDETVNVSVEFMLRADETLVSANMLGGAGSYATQAMNRDAGISFVLMRDNEPSESYGVNSLTIEVR